MCDDDVTIGVTEVVNNIQVTTQPNDQIIDIDVIDNSDEVTLNVTPCLIEVNINKGSSFARWGTIYGNILDQTDLQNALFNKADLVNGVVPANQLPSYVDDVIEVANFAALPTVGETGKIYITLDNNKMFRWSGSVYVEISSGGGVWGAITGTLSNQTDLQTALDAKQPLDGDLTSIAGLTGTSGLLRKTAANTYSLDTNSYALDSEVVKLTGNQTIQGAKTFEDGIKFDSDLHLKQDNIISTPSGYTTFSGTSTGFWFHNGASRQAIFSLANTSTLRTYELPNKDGTFAMLSDITSANTGSLEFNATDLTVWNNGKGNVSTNTSFGDGALKSNTTGTNNIAYGGSSLLSNTTGSYNVALGGSTLLANTIGGSNIAIGDATLVANTTGNANVGVGLASLSSNTTGVNNVALGSNSLSSNTIGLNNTAIGTQAGAWAGASAVSNTNSTTSVFIGADSRPLADNQTNQIVIGNSAIGHGSNTVTLGNSSIVTTILRGNVGIGTTSPAYKLQITETATGAPAIGLQSTNAAGYSGVHFLNPSSGLEGHMGFGNSSTGSLSNLFYFGSIAARDVVITTNDTTRFTIYSNGNYQFFGSNISDERAKENINNLDFNATEKVMALQPKSYYMKNDDQKIKYGFIAQEVYEVLPDLINGDFEEDGFVGLDYNGIIAVMVNAIQELKAEIDLLKQKA